MIRKKSIPIDIGIMDCEFFTDKDVIEASFWLPRWKCVEISATSQSSIIRNLMKYMRIEVSPENHRICCSADDLDNFLYLLLSYLHTETQMYDKEMNPPTVYIYDALTENPLNL